MFIIILTCTIGALDEIHQLYLPGRKAAFSDFVADFVGSWFTVAFLKSMLEAF